jgi:hypothetical protein
VSTDDKPPDDVQDLAPPVPESTTGTDDDLREAVGVGKKKKKKEKRDAELDKLADVVAEDEADLVDLEARDESRGKRRMMVWLAISIFVGAVIATFVLLGRVNKDRYEIVCTATHIRAEQGRGFPPWGTEGLGGAEWKPVAIPPEAECTPIETEDIEQLRSTYLAHLMERIRVALETTNVTDVDAAAKQLEQALLLTRDPSRKDLRDLIVRTLGDIEYWRATARIRSSAQTLLEAATQFDAAVKANPRYVRDAAAWADLARRASTLLGAGPTGAGSGSATPPPNPARDPAPFGVALPIETPDAAPATPPPPPPDAGLPSGGVLL